MLVFLRPLLQRAALVMPLTTLALGVGLCQAASANADTVTSSNWSGYAVHRTGLEFERVSAQWVVPTADCAATAPAYSATWIGLGGYSETSQALEQTGTEADCSASGDATYFAWYELVPSAGHSISLEVHAGDAILGTVTVAGRSVTITLADLTNHRSFTRTFEPAEVDTSSAEWIVEAPSACSASDRCVTLPLANFGTTRFSAAQATTTSGRIGAISSSQWTHTKIRLVTGGSRFVVDGAETGEAVPGALSIGGSAFTVRYHETAGSQPGAGPTRPFFRSPAGS